MNKKTKNSNIIPPLKVEGRKTLIRSSDKANVLNSTFKKVFINDDGNLPTLSSHNKDIVPMPWTVISPSDVKKSIRNLKNSVSRTPDEIPAMFLKKCCSNLIQPLCELYNLSLSKNKVPSIWKEAIVTPIFKKGLKNDANNYRPISLTSVLCRVMEKIIQEKTIHHLLDNNLLSQNQHGFIPKRSTLSLHLNLLDELTTRLDNKTQVDMLYLDFSKAFDRVSHQKLIHTLSQYKIDCKIVNWLKDYLSCRRQRTVVENSFSNYCSISSGVPQGSVLGPMLFLLYVEDLLRLLQTNFPSIKAYAFADDLKLLGNNAKDLQDALDVIENWTLQWQLKIQPTKSECITFKSQYSHLPDNILKYNINNNEFSKTKIVKDLGLHLTTNLKWTSYIQKIRSKSNSLSHLILKSFRSVQPSIYITLYKTYVRPILEYNVSIWSTQIAEDIDLVEAAQRTFTRKLCQKLNIRYSDYSDRLKILKIESLEYRRLKMDLILVYKILNNLIDLDISKFFTISQINNKYNLRRHSLYLENPKSQSTLRRNFFSVRILNTWNNLPNTIVTSETLPLFKNKLSNFPLSSIYKFRFI